MDGKGRRMAKPGKVIWTEAAQKDRQDVFRYWNKRNKSTAYTKRLRRVLNQTTAGLLLHPQTGKMFINSSFIRQKVVEKFLMLYRIDNGNIILLRLFDTSQNPNKLSYP